MSNTNNESSNTIIELELKLFNLLETAFFTIRSYLIWSYAKVLEICKIDYFIDLVHVLICNAKARLNNSNTQRKNLLEWIQTKVRSPHSPTNFNDDWKNGITLCALIEGIVPGSCPRFDLLNPERPINNIRLGLTLIRKHLNIDSPIESQEIHDCTEEAKLVYFLSRIKFESVKMLMKSTLNRSIIEVKDSSGNCQKVFESLFGDEKACFAKGMGLILGVRTRKARFNIFCKPTAKLNLMIEISGPNNSMCSEKITVYSSKKRVSTDIVTSSLITDMLNRKKPHEENLKIPFFYEVFPNKIVVTYMPLMKGTHKLSIIWQGQHIMHSPYTVNVEDNGADSGRASESFLNPTSSTKFVPGLQYPVSALTKRDSLCFDETATVIGRKVLRQVVVVNGKEKVINDLKSEIMESSKQFNDISDFNLIDKKPNNCEICENPLDLNCENQIAFNNDFYRRNDDFDRRNDLFDIIETASIQSELYSPSKTLNHYQNNKSISYEDNNNPDSQITEQKEFINQTNHFEELSSDLEENQVSENIDSYMYDRYISNNDSGDDEILSFKQQIVTKPSSNTSQNAINNYSNRSFLPVKNMIHNWETKLSENVSNNNTKENNERNKIESLVRYSPVKNRCKIFEEQKIKDLSVIQAENENFLIGKEFRRHFIINDKKQFWEDLTTDKPKKVDNGQKAEHSHSSDDIQKRDELNDNKCDNKSSSLNNVNKYLTEQPMNENCRKLLKSSLEVFSSQTAVNTPESQPDSGISTNIFCNMKNDHQNQQNLSRQKSFSYPDLNRLANSCIREFNFFKDNYNDDQNNNTRTSSLVGQFIDDEIPDYSSLFLGEYVSYTGLLNTDRPMTYDDIKFDDLVDEESDSNTNRESLDNSTANIGIYPEKCQVFGAGVYYGQVGIKNHFVVSTKEGGKSFLSVGVQSAEQEDVIEVTVTSIGEKNYEVLYEVSRPGYYIIFVKWGDYNVADSPFICKVTY